MGDESERFEVFYVMKGSENDGWYYRAKWRNPDGTIAVGGPFGDKADAIHQADATCP